MQPYSDTLGEWLGKGTGAGRGSLCDGMGRGTGIGHGWSDATGEAFTYEEIDAFDSLKRIHRLITEIRKANER